MRDELLESITGARWFGSKAREVVSAQIIDRTRLREPEPSLDLALAEVRFPPGTHETYQLLLGPGDSDGLVDPLLGRELVHLIKGGATIQTPEGAAVEFRPLGSLALGRELQTTRPVGAEQSNSSLVFEEELILKVYRRV